MTIDEALRQAAADAARGVVTFPADLHGFPGTAHGGAVAAVFHRLPLDASDLDLLQRAVDREAPDLAPLLVRMIDRLIAVYRRDAVRVLLSRA